MGTLASVVRSTYARAAALRGVIAFGCLMCFFGASAVAQDLRTVRVEAGDTCRSIAARELGDPSAVALLHRHNPQLGPTPHQLVPGTTLHVPSLPAPARLRSVVRRVESRPPDRATFGRARAGEALPRSTHVRTYEESSAEIAFVDGAEVTVRERTLVIVYGGERRLTQRPIGRAELERGALRSRLAELAGRQPLEVSTPSSRASLEGAAVVSVEADGTSRVANHGRRDATIVASGRRIRLPADTGTVVRRGGAPSPPRALLAAPRWRADQAGIVLGFAGRGAILTGGFEGVPGAARYRVEIARRADGGELATVIELAPDATRFDAPGMSEGTFYASVASIDDAGLEGRRSPWRAFTVRLARLVAPGGVERDASADPVRVVVGTWFVAPRGVVSCSDERSHGTLLTLTTPGALAIRCEDARGSVLGPLHLEVIEPVVELATTEVVRDRVTTVELVVQGAPPISSLAMRASNGFTVSNVRSRGARVLADVAARADAPDRAELTLDVMAGAERVVLATLVLDVSDPHRTAGTARAARHDRHIAQGVLADLAWPSVLSLRDERRDGFGAWLSAAVVDSGADEPTLRVGAGARATLPGAPLRIGFASQLDALGPDGAVDRRGSADLIGSLGALLIADEVAALAVDFSVWIPTRGEPESLGRVRLAPSVEGSLRAHDWLVLRTRQGALVDATEEGARAWAWAVGADFIGLDAISIGAELDATIGRFADRDGAALGLGVGLEWHLPPLELGLGGRIGLTDEAITLWGAWSAVLSVRVFAE